MAKKPTAKPTKKPRKRGPKEERLVIADDPQTALITLLNFRPAKPARKK
jgi:hypothetical protein